jgi:hypothetical protein
MSAKKKVVTADMIVKDIKAYKKMVADVVPTPREVHSVEEFLKITKELKQGEYIVWRDFVEEKVEVPKDFFEPKNGCPHYKVCVSAGLKCLSCRKNREYNGYSTITYPYKPLKPYGTLI